MRMRARCGDMRTLRIAASKIDVCSFLYSGYSSGGWDAQTAVENRSHNYIVAKCCFHNLIALVLVIDVTSSE
jgi:hypothetical protein